MSTFLASILSEYQRYKKLADDAMAQVVEKDLSAAGPSGGSSIAVICWHVSGNLRSRFTDFLTADGEKAWRNREEEFEARSVTRDELRSKWEQGWTVLFQSLNALRPEDLDRQVKIRGQAMAVHDALHRSLAHASYHVGQIVYLAKAFKGKDWTYLSIPPGKSDAFNTHLGAGSSRRADGPPAGGR
jgi:hypothetical protein